MKTQQGLTAARAVPRSGRSGVRALLALGVLQLLLAGPAARAQDALMDAILSAQDEAGRGRSSAATMVMTVRTGRYERALTM